MNDLARSIQAVHQRASLMPSMPCAIGFYLAARLAITYLFFTSDPQTGAVLSVGLNLLLLLPAIFYVFGAERELSRGVFNVGAIRCVGIYLLVSLVSILWTAALSRTVALGYWSSVFADVALVWLLCGGNACGSVEVLRGYIYGASFIGVVIWCAPTMQDLRPGNDDFFSPNAIGFTCGLGVLLAQLLARLGKPVRHVIPFLSITMLRTLSKTTIVAFVVAQGVLLFWSQPTQRSRKCWVALASLGVLLVFLPLLARYYDVYLNAGNQAETLTGRVGIWAVVLERSLQQPWIGHGFHSFRNVIPAFGTFEAWHAHNEWLQQFYLYGLLGLFMLASFYISLWRLAKLVNDPQVRVWLYCLVIFVVIRGLADAERFDLSLPLWAVLCISFVLLSHSESSHQVSYRGAL